MRFIYNFEVFYLHKLLLALEFNGKITRIMITIWLQTILFVFIWNFRWNIRYAHHESRIWNAIC